MKITALKIRQVTGTMESDGQFWEERLVQPTDIYPEFRERHGRQQGEQVDDTHVRLTQQFVQIDTDAGVSGICTAQPAAAYIAYTQLRPLLVGRDPLATEFLWDIMHRSLVHGRQGEAMMAISAVDNALWDLKGKYLGQPVYRLAGGPTQKTMPAYASMLGYDTSDMGLVRERALQMKERGFRAQKWFFRHGPMSGPDGMKHGVEMVKTLRNAVGDDTDIMLDAWQSWDYDYAVRMTSQLEEYHPRWLEEVAMPDRIDTYKRIKEKTSIPLSGAEHEYTRWGFKRFLDADALDIIQPDLGWAGGFSELLKIAALATSYDRITICHQGVTPQGMAFSATQPPIHTPYVEMLIKHAAFAYHLAKEPVQLDGGMLTVSDSPGFGFDLDESKIESEEEITY